MFEMELPTYLWMLVASSIALYVILDASDLGASILSIFCPDRRYEILLNTKNGHNEIWLVFALFSFSLIFTSAAIAAIPFMKWYVLSLFLSLIARSFFRNKWLKSVSNLSYAGFWLSTLISLVAQSFLLIPFLVGFGYTDEILHRLLVTIMIPYAYILIGSAWILKRWHSPAWKKVYLLIFLFITNIFPAMIFLSPGDHPWLIGRWHNFSNITWLWPAPILYMIASVQILMFWFRQSWEKMYNWTIVIMIAFFWGLLGSIWPWILPPYLDIYQGIDNYVNQFIYAAISFIIIPILVLITVNSEKNKN